MLAYHYAGKKIESESELRLLPEIATSSCDLDLLLTVSCQHPLSSRAVHFVSKPYQIWKTNNGMPWLEFYREDDIFKLHFPKLAVFSLKLKEKSITVHLAPKLDRASYEHLLLDTVVPLFLSELKEFFVFHGAALSKKEQAIAFVGASGCGKSTLASFFSRNDWKVLSDDVLIVDRDGFAYPSYPGVRKWPEEETRPANSETQLKQVRVSVFNEKVREVANFASAKTRLAALYSIDANDGHGRAFLSLAASCFTLQIDSSERAIAHLEFLNRLKESIPICSLAYQKDAYGLEVALRKAEEDTATAIR